MSAITYVVILKLNIGFISEATCGRGGMSRLQNMVVSGAYKGKIVSAYNGVPYILIKFSKMLVLDESNVKEIVLVDTDSEISVASAAKRAFIGEMMFGPIGLSAAGTANRINTHIVEIIFNDGQKCVLEIDDKLYELLMAANT